MVERERERRMVLEKLILGANRTSGNRILLGIIYALCRFHRYSSNLVLSFYVSNAR